MATKEYAIEIQRFNNNLEKYSQMLLETEVLYCNFSSFQIQEKLEQTTNNYDNEAIGNGLDEQVMEEANAAESEWKKKRCDLLKPNLESFDKDAPLAWTKRRTGNHSKTIYINDTFFNRIKNASLKPEMFEWRVIVVAQAFAIIHETGHLSLGWKGILNTLSVMNYSEAGDRLETNFLDFLFSLLVARPYQPVTQSKTGQLQEFTTQSNSGEQERVPWDSTQPIRGMLFFLLSLCISSLFFILFNFF